MIVYKSSKVNVNEKKLLKDKEVSLILSVSVRQVWRLVALGLLTPPIKISNSSRFLESEVNEFINKQMALRTNLKEGFRNE